MGRRKKGKNTRWWLIQICPYIQAGIAKLTISSLVYLVSNKHKATITDTSRTSKHLNSDGLSINKSKETTLKHECQRNMHYPLIHITWKETHMLSRFDNVQITPLPEHIILHYLTINGWPDRKDSQI